jgi:hypothetical protein
MQMFLQKVHVAKTNQKKDQKNNASFSSMSLFYSALGRFSAMGVYTTTKITSESRRKVLQKNRQKPKTDCFLRFYFIMFLGVSRRGEFCFIIKTT